MFNLELIEKIVANYKADEVDTDISVNDAMNNQWYSDVERSAVEVILASIMSSYVHKVDHVLDLPCGHGPVLRRLVKMFPNAVIHACDLDTEGGEYCARQFGAKPVVSVPELTEVDFGVPFDLIWVSSLFMLVSEAQSVKWLNHLSRFLSSYGIVVATMHGRWSENVNSHSPFIGAERWQTVLDGYRATGYGYSDYVQEQSSQYTPGNCGVSMARHHAELRLIEQIKGVRIFS